MFVEVRSRTGEAQGHPLETITAQKRARVIRAARLYLAAEAPSAAGYRFDVVAVTFREDDGPPEIVHVPNAFEVGTRARPDRPAARQRHRLVNVLAGRRARRSGLLPGDIAGGRHREAALRDDRRSRGRRTSSGSRRGRRWSARCRRSPSCSVVPGSGSLQSSSVVQRRRAHRRLLPAAHAPSGRLEADAARALEAGRRDDGHLAARGSRVGRRVGVAGPPDVLVIAGGKPQSHHTQRHQEVTTGRTASMGDDSGSEPH